MNFMFDDPRPAAKKPTRKKQKSFISEDELVKRYIVLNGARLSVENEHCPMAPGTTRRIMGTNESLAHAAHRVGWAEFLTA